MGKANKKPAKPTKAMLEAQFADKEAEIAALQRQIAEMKAAQEVAASSTKKFLDSSRHNGSKDYSEHSDADDEPERDSDDEIIPPSMTRRRNKARVVESPEPSELPKPKRTRSRAATPKTKAKAKIPAHRPAEEDDDDLEDEARRKPSPAFKPSMPPKKRKRFELDDDDTDAASDRTEAINKTKDNTRSDESEHDGDQEGSRTQGDDAPEPYQPYIGSSDEDEPDTQPSKRKKKCKWPLERPRGEIGRTNKNGREGFNLREAMGYPEVDPSNKTHKYIMKHTEFIRIRASARDIASQCLEKGVPYSKQHSKKRGTAVLKLEEEYPFLKTRYVRGWALDALFTSILTNRRDQSRRLHLTHVRAKEGFERERKGKTSSKAPPPVATKTRTAPNAVAASSSGHSSNPKKGPPRRVTRSSINIDTTFKSLSDYEKPTQAKKKPRRKKALNEQESEIEVDASIKGKVIDYTDL